MLNQVVLEFLGTDAPTDGDWNEKIPSLVARNDVLETENAGLKEETAELKATVAKLEALKPKSELGEKYLVDTREAAKVAYLKAKGDGALEAMVKTIGTADLEQAQALKAEFEAEVEKRFPLKCGACGQTQLSRRSSVEEGVDDEKSSDADDKQFKIGG